MIHIERLALIPMAALCLAWAQQSQPEVKVKDTYRVKYVAKDAVYLDGGRNEGLMEGMRLTVKRAKADVAAGDQGPPVAELVIAAVADASSVCDIKSSSQLLAAGDVAYLAAQDVDTIRALRSSAAIRNYPQVITFTEGDPIDQEAREAVPRPPSPEINRFRGRIGFEYGSIMDRSGGGLHSSQEGLILQTDMTRIGGTYWNLRGYWRGQLQSSQGSSQTQTLNDLINRTYHLQLTYDNPKSNWVMGVGRLYLPFAPSLDTLDGGYVGRRFGKRFTAGLFAGSTPDPTSWSYAPNRTLTGTFLNYETGSYDKLRFTSTVGAAISRISWRPDRQFLFFENVLSFKTHFSLYHSMEVEQPKGQLKALDPHSGIGRSFLTLRMQPYRILSFDLSHNYFKDVPTFDPRLIGTGLLDRYLFQGVSAGFRLQWPWRITWYSSVGRNLRKGDSRSSLNQMFGITLAKIPRTGVTADVRYSVFDSSFGRGKYSTLILNRQVGDTLRFEAQAGEQSLASVSALTQQNRSRFINGNLDWFLASHYFLGAGYTAYRGKAQNYDQLYINLGYRFR